MTERQDDVERFGSWLRSLRQAGAVYFHVGPAASDWHLTKPFTDAIDAVAQKVGLRGLGSGFHGWHELGHDQAREILVELLWRDLAYRAELMSEAAARELADGFIAFFQPGALYFSNRSADGSWMSLADTTFDTGVIALNRDLCGILWVADED